ncbi:MAG: VWA domain-containing protein, partial [Akkermansia sp.]|nr:VWA domain-containing protein [Akkermansia sp.]
MSFLYPYVLIALLLPLLLAVLAILNHRQARQSWQLLVAPAHRAALVRKPPLWRTVLPAALGLLALTFGILAAARPINGYTDSGAVSSGRNLIIALDVSRSMETTDVTPSRLEEARTAAYELINALPTDKIGLIIFSGEADLVVP